MKKIILVGRSGCGKTSLSQALKGELVHYDKTQYIHTADDYIDTPGEYCETKLFGGALATYSYESDVVGLVQSATEPFSLFPPAVAASANRPVIGIITKADVKAARIDLARSWLQNAGCEQIFTVSSVTGAGIDKLMDYLKAPL